MSTYYHFSSDRMSRRQQTINILPGTGYVFTSGYHLPFLLSKLRDIWIYKSGSTGFGIHSSAFVHTQMYFLYNPDSCLRPHCTTKLTLTMPHRLCDTLMTGTFPRIFDINIHLSSGSSRQTAQNSISIRDLQNCQFITTFVSARLFVSGCAPSA